MVYYKVEKNSHFIGRKYEFQRLDEIYKTKEEAKLLIVYGRRRIGKTELIEQYFRSKKIWKFEGIQISSEDKRSDEEIKQFQIQICLKSLSKYLNNKVIEKLNFNTWTDFFNEIDPIARTKEIVIYFEELQWLANYRNHFFAELKPFWDSYWRKNKGLTLVFCGSSTSFFTENLLFNQALYSRDQDEFHVKELNLIECTEFLNKRGVKEIMLAHLVLGGIPAYLKRITASGTVLSKICLNSFTQDSFYLKEFDKIFISRMSEYKYYKKIIEYLAKQSSSTTSEIYKAISASKSIKVSGKFLKILEDLEECGFISSFVPLMNKSDSKLVKYRIADEYLHFYYKFIFPIKDKIENGFYNENPQQALNRSSLEKALGFSFERWCIKNQNTIAKILQIDKLNYHSGSYFKRKIPGEGKGFQIDLMYIVENVKLIFCEIKYYKEIVKINISEDLDRKIEKFFIENQKFKNVSIEKVLITTEGISEKNQTEFDTIITYKDLFSKQFWPIQIR
jgi:hypothetical protein